MMSFCGNICWYKFLFYCYLIGAFFLLSGCAEKEICCQRSIRFSIFVYSIRGTSYYGIWISTAPMKSISMLKPGLVSLELETIICKQKDYNSNVKCQILQTLLQFFYIFPCLLMPYFHVTNVPLCIKRIQG